MIITPMTGGLGAEITGADIRDAAQFGEIFEAFSAHSVIAIRDQQIGPEDQIAFAERFGPINVNRFFAKVPGHPRVAMLLREPQQTASVGEGWHTDHSYDQAPAMCSILHCVETPPVGGDTIYASMTAAFDALSEGLKQTLRGLKVWHSSRHSFGAAVQDSESARDGRINNPELATQDALHPVVIRHPLSGREALYVNPEFTTRFDGWSAEDSAPLLAYLYQHAVKPEFTCRVRYATGTVVVWDNRATWHKAINDFQGQRRLMHRVTVEGVELSAAA